MIRLIRFKIFRIVKNKLGSELVEATIVLPIVLLIILGILSFLVFFFDNGISQFRAHMDLIESSSISTKLFEIDSIKIEQQKDIRALSKKTYFSHKQDGIYVLNEENILRIGDAAVDAFK